MVIGPYPLYVEKCGQNIYVNTVTLSIRIFGFSPMNITGYVGRNRLGFLKK